MPTNALAGRSRVGYNGDGKPGCLRAPASLSSSPLKEGHMPNRHFSAPSPPVNRTSSPHACAGGA